MTSGPRQVRRVLEALVLPPRNVEARLVPGEQLVDAVGAPAGVRLLLAPRRLSGVRGAGLEDVHELVEVLPLQRVR
jgi:hypothetical protein